MFHSWSDEAIRGYIIMIEETFMKGSMRSQYEQKVSAARQELVVREHRRLLAQQEAARLAAMPVSGSKS